MKEIQSLCSAIQQIQHRMREVVNIKEVALGQPQGSGLQQSPLKPN